ncbi:hypothetical protein BDR07DRAFT_1607734 [Suillus spraguei]|nr:hypothetical protein BDR07DRAFT_1607734 [Suillus spraguei]
MSEHPHGVTAFTGFKLQAQDPGQKNDKENGKQKDSAAELGTGVSVARTFDPPQDKSPTTMSPTVTDLSEDAHSFKSPPVPTGWTAKSTHPIYKTVETMLNYSTGLTASLELAEDRGSCYIFSSGKSYYIWNTTSEDGWRILNAKDRDELYTNVANGRLELEELPDFGSDLEG